jgi:hypothetical protein
MQTMELNIKSEKRDEGDHLIADSGRVIPSSELLRCPLAVDETSEQRTATLVKSESTIPTTTKKCPRVSLLPSRFTFPKERLSKHMQSQLANPSYLPQKKDLGQIAQVLFDKALSFDL